MNSGMLQCTANETLPVGKDATVQEFIAKRAIISSRSGSLPRGEGHFKVNGRKISQVENVKDRRQAFRGLADITEQYVKEHPPKASVN